MGGDLHEILTSFKKAEVGAHFTAGSFDGRAAWHEGSAHVREAWGLYLSLTSLQACSLSRDRRCRPSTEVAQYWLERDSHRDVVP